MAATMPSTASPARAPVAFSLGIVLVHLVLIASLGQYYAKLQIPLGSIQVYPTEVVVVLAAVFGVRAIRSVPFDRITKLVLAFLGFGIAWVAIAGIGPMDGAGAKALSFFFYAILYFVVRGTATTEAARWRILRVFGVASIVAVGLGVIQVQLGTQLFSDAAFEVTTTGSTRWLPGEFALYALFGAIVIVVDAIIRRRITRAGALAVAAATAELVLAQHRSGFVALAIALLATAAFLGGSGQALKNLLKVIVISAVAIAIFMWLFGGDYLDQTIDRISHTSDLSDVNIEWRLLNWYEVGDGIVVGPLGHGFATWSFLFTAVDPLVGSHNSFLDLTYRIGIPGLVVFIAMPITLIAQTRQRIATRGASALIQPITVCACMMAFLVFASFNVVFETPHMSIFFWVLLGAGAAALDDQG